MTSGWLIACDLDQTLIYSRRAFRIGPEAAAPRLTVVEYLDGEPLSYLTETAARGLAELARLVPVVPVTTRTLAQYGRVDLGFRPSYAIAANGGHLLVDGRADPGWESVVRSRLESAGLGLEDIRSIAEEAAATAVRAGAPWVRTIRDADGLFLYLVAGDRAAIPDLSELAAELEAAGWALSVQGRKVYLVPEVLTKEAAIAEVVRRTGADRVAAAGDSLLDLGMLRAAQVAVRPAHGELHDQGLQLPHLQVSRSSGVVAGEEIVATLQGFVARSGDSRNGEVTFPVPAG